jgi:hypothetical protein
MRKMPPWLAVVVTLVAAYMLDRWLESARGMATARMGVSSFQWFMMAAGLVFAGCVLVTAWLLFTQRGQHRGLALLCVILGLVILILPTPPFCSLGMRLPGLLVPLLRASPYSFFGHAGAFLTVLGLAALLVPANSQADHVSDEGKRVSVAAVEPSGTSANVPQGGRG